MRTSNSSTVIELLTAGALGGIAGGLAEIGWISLYGIGTGIPLSPIARGIVGSLIPTLAPSAWAIELGVLIHLGLAVALGISLALIVRLISHRLGAHHADFAVTMLLLAGVWAVNFLVVLPEINPAFVHLLPYGVTLLSKLLFGLAAAMVLQAGRRRVMQVSVR